jgi:thioesterase domain-containing protein
MPGHRVLLCVPPVPGSWDCYAAMRAAAPAGIELRSLVGGRDFEWNEASTIEQLAQGCADYSRRGQTPFGMLGWSTGGVIAAECAARLHDDGHPLRCLVLVDAMFPAALPTTAPRGHMVEMLIAFLAARGGVELDPETRTQLAARVDEGFDALLAALDQRGLLAPNTDASRLARLLAAYERGVARGNELLLHYSRTRRAFDHELVERLILLRATRSHPAADAWFATDPVAWRAIGRHVAVDTVEGDHYSLTQSAGAASVAVALDRYLGSLTDQPAE